MISLILPYWDRQQAANNAFKSLAIYEDMDELEIIVVDDGNKVPFVLPDTNLNVRIIRMPHKDHPTPQSKAWNAGVRAAKGDIVILSCVEVIHETPVIQHLVDELSRLEKKGYVMASAWCPDENRWHCHSTELIPTLPSGTGPSFCTAIYKQFFNEIGGFDDIYHLGAGYEDKDFVQKLQKAGAKFAMRDDLMVIHPKAGARINWPQAGFDRNARIYAEKWGFEARTPVTFVCLKAGDGYGPEYVNILHDMVRRNLGEGYLNRFVCMTDDATGLDERIEVIELPSDLETWWGKLYMFKRGLFNDGERLIFMDLDTVIVSQLDDLADYDGQFATLQDFYHPDRLGPALIAWQAGEYTASIWDEWVAEGKPRNPMGDLWWLNRLDQGRFAKRADKLQKLYPDMFVSYKAHAMAGIPKKASVVCFHGLPRPHEVGGWVKDIWKIGGLSSSDMEVINNVSDETIRNNIHASSLREMPWLELKPETDREILIVGGGPSLANDIEIIRIKQNLGAYVLALNGTGEYLKGKGIIPDAVIMIDAREFNIRFIESDPATHYFLASQCHSMAFDMVGHKSTLFHIDIPDIGALVPGYREIQAVGGGVTVGLIALSVAYTQGYRNMHLFGYDSSYQDETHHAYKQTENDGEPILFAHVSGKSFKAAPWMIMQVNQFQELARQLNELGCSITTHGTGLLPTVAWQMMAATQLLEENTNGN